MSLITIKSKFHDYTVSFPKSFEFLDHLEEYPERCYAIDKKVWDLYRDGPLQNLDPRNIIVVPIAEDLKNLESAERLYDQLIQRSAKRNLTLIAIGGGILQDITGFVSSTLYRGINWIFAPTTLLSQADSCIGAKTSLNYKAFKNLIGTFYPPSQVIVHIPFLLTQEDVDFYSGLGEVVKLHMIGGMDKINTIIKSLPSIIRREPQSLYRTVADSLLIKQEYIEGDEFDMGKRAMLNFGHCFGHAIESTAEFEIPHGQAVVIGMILANLVARERGIISKTFCQFLLDKLLLPSLVVKVKRNHRDHAKIVEAMQKDKKRVGKGLALVMIGNDCRMFRVNDLEGEEVAKALHAAESLLAPQ